MKVKTRVCVVECACVKHTHLELVLVGVAGAGVHGKHHGAAKRMHSGLAILAQTRDGGELRRGALSQRVRIEAQVKGVAESVYKRG